MLDDKGDLGGGAGDAIDLRSEIASGELQAWPLRARAFWHLTLIEAPDERRNEAASALSAMMRATVRDLLRRGYWPGSSQAD